MRLLNVHTLMLEEFLSEQQRPKYIILSHRWGDDEVSFKEWRKGLKTSGQGYEKIIACCRFIKARPNWPQYVWIDTIAIDKRSSAELSEAINSMYQWYAQATVCIAYLSDIAGPWPSDKAEFLERTLALLSGSVYFTRGWTLQELIAPKRMIFCSAEWLVLGWKARGSEDSKFGKLTMADGSPCITSILSKITGIGSYVLQHPQQHQKRSMATRMSWASRRETTRPEDLAYSLLGLFSVNMPLLYGEGASKAFIRLQLEIIRKSTDDSIFAWQKQSYSNSRGLLCPSPKAFTSARNIWSLCNEEPSQAAHLKLCGPLTDSRFLAGRSSYSMTNKGLEFRAPAWLVVNGYKHVYVVWLACARRSSEEGEEKRMMQTQSGRLQQTSQCCVILEAHSEDDVNDRVRRSQYVDIYKPLWTQYPPETWQDVGEKCFEIIQDGL
ncbi:hypothetical protein LTR27_001248 [Elasticomyces elasticus]|nr:hypothetical protein LTR27_001248 [Elasticomyces elasticus]